MPYQLKRSGSGWVVVTEGTGATHSKKPLTHLRAIAQMRALYASEPAAARAEVHDHGK